MTESQKKLEESYDRLKQMRDELKVQLNLGKKEAKERWEKVEKDLDELQVRMKAYAEKGEKQADKWKKETRDLIGDVRTRLETYRKNLED